VLQQLLPGEMHGEWIDSSCLGILLRCCLCAHLYQLGSCCVDSLALHTQTPSVRVMYAEQRDAGPHLSSLAFFMLPKEWQGSLAVCL